MSVEDSQQTPFAPGCVSSEEILLRIIFSPDHIDINGNLKPEAIPSQDLKERGFSVQRKLFVSKKRIYENIDHFVSRKESRFCKGISPIKCEVVRSIEDNQLNKVFNVIDDALTENDHAHAKIMFKNSYGRSMIKSLRKKLLDEFSVILEVKHVVDDLPADRPLIRLKRKFKQASQFLETILNTLKS